MSVYADYMKLSQNYDKTRPPSGVSLYLGMIYSMTGKVTSDLHMLDAGCGTGNHSLYLIQHGVQRITMLDASEGMLQKSRDKLSKYSDRIEILQGVLPKLDFPDAHFDVVMVNQVIQHLSKPGDDKFSNVQKLLKEVYRVLKSNGLVLIAMDTPCQLRHGYWYYKVFPRAMEEFVSRIMEADELIHLISDAGFEESNAVVPVSELVLSEECYFRKDGPLYDDWLNSNSATARHNVERLGELEEGQNLIRNLKKEGKLDEFFAEADSRRAEVGQYTIFYGKKK